MADGQLKVVLKVESVTLTKKVTLLYVLQTSVKELLHPKRVKFVNIHVVVQCMFTCLDVAVASTKHVRFFN